MRIERGFCVIRFKFDLESVLNLRETIDYLLGIEAKESTEIKERYKYMFFNLPVDHVGIDNIFSTKQNEGLNEKYPRYYEYKNAGKSDEDSRQQFINSTKKTVVLESIINDHDKDVDAVYAQYLLINLESLQREAYEFRLLFIASDVNEEYKPLLSNIYFKLRDSFALTAIEKTLVEKILVYYHYKTKSKNEIKWQKVFDEKKESSEIGRILPFIPITKDSFVALISTSCKTDNAWLKKFEEIVNKFIKDITKNDGLLRKKIVRKRIENKFFCVVFDKIIHSQKLTTLEGKKLNKLSINVNEVEIKDKIEGLYKEIKNLSKIQEEVDKIKSLIELDSYIEKLIFVYTLRYIIEDENIESIIKAQDIALLHELCVDYAQGITQIIENAWQHVISDSNGCGYFALRIRKKEDATKLYLRDGNSFEEEGNVNYFMELYVTDMNFKKDVFQHEFEGFHRSLQGMIGKFLENLQNRAKEKENEIDKFNKSLEVAPEDENLKEKLQERTKEKEQVEKHFKAILGNEKSPLSMNDLFGVGNNTAYGDYLNDPLNIAHHYGLQILANVVNVNDGYFCVRSGSNEDRYKYENIGKDDKNFGNNVFNWSMGTAYAIYLPIRLEKSSIDYRDTAKVQLINQAKLDINENNKNYMYIKISSKNDETEFLLYANKKESEVNDFKNNLYETIFSKKKRKDKWNAERFNEGNMAQITIKENKIGEVNKELWGSFVEQMGRAVYGGIYEVGHPLSDGEGFRTDVIDVVKETNLSIVRYPGGNVVSGFDWKDSIGKNRKTRLNLAWQQIETNEVGLHEFYRWAEKVDAQVMMAINLGTGTVKDALELVEYCNFEGHTYWSDLRRENGREEPFNIQYWCLGNEMDGIWQICCMEAKEYGVKARETSKLMKKIDPSIKTVLVGSNSYKSPTYPEWDKTVLDIAYEFVDYIAIHCYFEMPEKQEQMTADKSVTAYLEQYKELDQYIKDVWAIIQDIKAKKRTEHQIYISLDEWNVWRMQNDSSTTLWKLSDVRVENTYTLLDALLIGNLICTMASNCDKLKVGCFAQLVNVIGLIMVNDRQVIKQTSFYPFAFASNHLLGQAKQVEMDGVHAVVCENDKEYALLAVNNHETEEDLVVEFPKNVSKVFAEIMDGDIFAQNNDDAPERVKPRKIEVEMKNQRCKLKMSGLSMLTLTAEF